MRRTSAMFPARTALPCCAFAGAVLVGAAAAAAGPASLVLTNANVHTLDPTRPHAETICIAAERIVRVGSIEETRSCVGERTRTIDLHGATVVPGWTDAHYHLSGVGWREMRLNLAGTPNAAALARSLAERVAKASPNEWIVGRGWIETHWQPPQFPSRALIDPVSPRNPVWLERADGHAALVNSVALRLAGIDAAFADPPGGRVLRDANGEPTGMLIDKAAELVSALIPAADDAQERAALVLAGERSTRLGLTMIHDAGRTGEGERADWDDVAQLRRLYADGRYKLRVYKAIVGPGAGAARLLRDGPIIGDAGGRLTVRTIKLQMDGALGSRGAALLEPYSDEPGTRGLFRLTDAVVRPLLAAALTRGIQVETHAIGDHANRHTLDLYEEAFTHVPRNGRAVQEPRWRIEHAQIVHPGDRPRFAALGVIPSMQPSHAIGDLYFAPSRLSPERLAHAYSWRSFIDLGLPVPGGSDAPVERGEPMIEFYAAVARKDLEGKSGEGWHPEQAVERLDALRMFTTWPAYAAFMERDLGSIEPGKLADLTVLSADILEIPAPQILQTTAVMTVINGEVVYVAD